MIRTMNVPRPEGVYRELPLYSNDYEIQINGQPCPVYSCRVSAMPFNRVWPGTQRPIEQTEVASYVSFSADETVTLQVKCRKAFCHAVIRPLSKQIQIERREDTVEFTLEKCGQYVLELDDVHFALHIFYNPIRGYSEEEKKAATYYFGPGFHFEQRVTLRDNESLYVDDDAVLFASVYAKGAKNIKIFGGGVIDGSCERRIMGECMGAANGNIRLCDCESVIVEDVILRDAACFVFNTYDSKDIEVDNIKILGQWRYNTDGIDPVNTSGMVIKNSFIRSFDDSISIKGAFGKDMVIENITVDNCVIWCDWGTSFRVGEIFVRETRNIVFRNCDLIHGFTAFDALNYGQADVHDVTYENINIEYQNNWLPPVYQASEDQIYDPTGRKVLSRLINVENDVAILGVYGVDTATLEGAGPTLIKCKGMKDSSVHDFVYRNIHIYLEEGAAFPDISIVSPREDIIHRNFLIDGLYINGIKETDISRLRPKVKNAENIVLK